VQGQNILAANAMISVGKRYSIYIVKGQAGIGGGATTDTTAPAARRPPRPASCKQRCRPRPRIPPVPRYRPKVTLGESQLTAAQMQARANWQKQFAYGQATKANISVQGFARPTARCGDQPDRRLHRAVAGNQRRSAGGESQVRLDEKGQRPSHGIGTRPGSRATRPTPPSELHKAKHGKGGGINWSGGAEFHNGDATDAAIKNAVTVGKVVQTVVAPARSCRSRLEGTTQQVIELLLPPGYSANPIAQSDVLLLQVLGSGDHVVALAATWPAMRSATWAR